jgi:hypothetical protein
MYLETHDDLVKNVGKKVTCYIEGEFIEDGEIYVDMNKWIYIFQNNKPGCSPMSTIPHYEYSWGISSPCCPYEGGSRRCTRIILKENCNVESNILKKVETKNSNYKTSHYDFKYNLSESDIEKGSVKIDPYFVANEWRLGEKDNSGILFHSLKTIARFGTKNEVEREVKALYFQAKRMAELLGIKLEKGE